MRFCPLFQYGLLVIDIEEFEVLETIKSFIVNLGETNVQFYLRVLLNVFSNFFRCLKLKKSLGKI